jgi:membrane fusion protein (multidrug efflux system)
MFMSLELTLSQSDRVVVPEEAIVLQAAETYVFTVTDGKARRVTVKTGQRRDGIVAILEGLEDGTQVVIHGLHRLRDGKAVRILNSDETAADGGDS